MEKKQKTVTRGISKNFAEAFKKCELCTLYMNHIDELFIGVRNNYLNFYYNCDSIAKIQCNKKGPISCEIDRYYLDGEHYTSEDKKKRVKASPKTICDEYERIKKHSDLKSTPEKKAQSRLVIQNNNNANSNWFCLDVEYVKQFRNQKEKKQSGFNGRFDIVALSRDNPHRVALIELKYGAGSMGGSSGIYKHVDDFKTFLDKGYFESHLKQEIIEIINSQIALGICVPQSLHENVVFTAPELFFITLDNNAKNESASTPKQTMAGYLFNSRRWGCKKLTTKESVETTFGDITKQNNDISATFLFSKATLQNIAIDDIIDGNYDDRIIPK